MPEAIKLLFLGVCAGILSGMFGIGGGVVIVPALILLFAQETKMAVGTSLGALLLPVGLLGVREYYLHKQINLSFSAWIALGLLIGALIGAKFALGEVTAATMKRLYGAFLIVIGSYFLFKT